MDAEHAIARVAAARGVLVETLSAFRAPVGRRSSEDAGLGPSSADEVPHAVSGRTPGAGGGATADPAPAIVLGYGGATPGQYERALVVLVESVRAVLTGGA